MIQVDGIMYSADEVERAIRVAEKLAKVTPQQFAVSGVYAFTPLVHEAKLIREPADGKAP